MTAAEPTAAAHGIDGDRAALRERIFDLVFLIGVLFKGIDGFLELVGGTVLLFVSPEQVRGLVDALTAGELRADPQDFIANLIVRSVARLDSGSVLFLSLFFLLHGVVKLVIVAALLRGTRRVYPWAIAALVGFLVYQVYEVITAASVGMILLAIFDVIIIALTWHEWRHGRTLRQTMHSTIDWVLRRAPAPQPQGTPIDAS